MNGILAELPVLTFAPVFSMWLLVPALGVLIALTFRLYLDQRRVASHRSVMLLTVLRVVLLLLVTMLFLQPALQWSHTHTSNGTLWLVVDQSPSMQSPDPQSSPAERRRWAEGVGVLPAPSDALRPALLLARVHVLHGRF